MGFDAADGDVGNKRPAHYPSQTEQKEAPVSSPVIGSDKHSSFSSDSQDKGDSKVVDRDVGMDLTKEDFEFVTAQVMKVADVCCNGRVVSVLEGGYGAYNSISPQLPKPTRANTRGFKDKNPVTSTTSTSNTSGSAPNSSSPNTPVEALAVILVILL
jgi:hypothetical protein